MKITSEDLKNLGIIDGIIKEPTGGAHRHAEAVITETGNVIASALASLSPLSGTELRDDRRQKFLAIGRNL